MHARFETLVSVTFTAAVVCVVTLAAITWKVGTDATKAANSVSHTFAVLASLARTRSDTVQIELNTQTFRTTGNPAALQERDAAVTSREKLLGQLKEQISDNAQQQMLWGQLRQVINERLAISRRVEELRKNQGFEAASAYVASAPLLETRNRTYRILKAMDAEERRLLELRSEEQLGARQRVVFFGALLSVLVTVMLAATYALIRRRTREMAAARQALAESEENLATTLHSIGDAVIATDVQGHITRMNRVAERLTGWPLAEARGLPMTELFHLLNEHTRAPVEIPVASVLASGLPQDLANHTVLVARNGSEIPIADSAAPIRDAQGKVRGVVIVFRDDTGARAAEQRILEQNRLLEQRVDERTAQLRDAQIHLRSVINSVPALIAYVDEHQHYIYVNAQYLERFAPLRDDITGFSVREILGEYRYGIAAPLIAKVLQGASQSYDWEPFPGIWQAISYLPRRNTQGHVEGYYVLGTDITERRQAEEALRASQQQLARVLEGADQGYWEWNLQTDTIQVSARWETMLGYQPGEMKVGTEYWPELVHPDDLPSVMALIQRHIAGETGSHDAEIRVKTKEGGWQWIQSRGRIVARLEDGAPLLMSGTHTDITERKRLELAQRQATVVFDNCYEGIMVTDPEVRITKVNPAFTRITGYEESEVYGKSPHILSSGRHDGQFYRDFWNALNQSGFWCGEICNQRKSGEIFISLQSVSVVRDARGMVQHYVSVFTDITLEKAHAMELDHVAHYDSLTELPNRRLLFDRLKQSISRSDRNSKLSAICFLDLDNFKHINDLYGHSVGDRFLVEIAELLKAGLRADDTLARLGGDEFVLILSDVMSPEECGQILDRVLQTVKQPVNVDGNLLSTSASIGVSLYPIDNADPDTLLRHADQAMYMAKQAGKNRYQMFDPEIDRITQMHREFLIQMRASLERNEFVLFYQPKVNLIDGSIIGAEALVRWQHPQRGLLQPGEFLGHLQGSELEATFGEWVIETALTQMEAWMGLERKIHVSVNISANHLLQPGFSERLRLALERHASVSADSLELEVLETADIGDMKQAVDILHRCMAFGVRFSLDDFGTGYSSLTFLRQLPVHTLKIDQSFVRDMLNDPDDLAIVQGVVELAGIFHRQVIAEGVETLEHGAALSKMGCHCVQGYGIAKPMPAADLPAWCGRWLEAGAWRHI